MTKPWRPLALAAVLFVSVSAGAATAQTVIVTKAPVGATIEVVLNADTVASGTADDSGNATLALNISKSVNKAETDASLYVDVCGEKVRRVLIVERVRQPPPPETGCDRRQIVGLFLIRSVRTDGDRCGWGEPHRSPQARSLQSSSSHPLDTAHRSGAVRRRRLRYVQHARDVACGNVNCNSDNKGFGYTAGVEYWFAPFLSAEASYLKPGDATAQGTSGTASFDSNLDLHAFTAAGKFGIPVRRGRFYGKAGATYQQSKFRTNQTFEDTTITVDGVTETIEGGTQALELETKGWSWFFGGGAEVWVRPAFAIFGEAGLAWLKGEAVDNEEGELDERLTYVLFGARVRIGW